MRTVVESIVDADRVLVSTFDQNQPMAIPGLQAASLRRAGEGHQVHVVRFDNLGFVLSVTTADDSQGSQFCEPRTSPGTGSVSFFDAPMRMD